MMIPADEHRAVAAVTATSDALEAEFLCVRSRTYSTASTAQQSESASLSCMAKCYHHLSLGSLQPSVSTVLCLWMSSKQIAPSTSDSAAVHVLRML